MSNGEIPPPAIPEVSQPAPREISRPDDRIRVGDVLELFVKEDPEFDGPYKVREAGDIILSGVGRIPVAGMSLSSARSKVEDALEENQLQKASVILDRVSRAPSQGGGGAVDSGGSAPGERKILVFITGKVNRPGQHTMALPEGRPLGVYEAILIAGGITRFGDGEKVYLLRTGSDGKKHKLPISLNEIEEGRVEDPPIGQGDIVVVPEKVFGF